MIVNNSNDDRRTIIVRPESLKSQMSEASPLDALPCLNLARTRIRYAQTRLDEDEQLLMLAIKNDNMHPFYLSICDQFKWNLDQDLAETLRTANHVEIGRLQAALEDAKENQSEEDVRIALQNFALFYLRIGDIAESKRQLAELYSHTVALGQKLDVVFCQMRLGFFTGDISNFPELLDQARVLIKEGGDWERKNRLKIYEGLSLCMRRNFIGAAPFFIGTLSTFTATEIMSYEDFIYRAVVLAVLALNRSEFGAKIDRSMEVRASDDSVHHLLSLYRLSYSSFFDALSELQIRLTSDLWFSVHLSYLIKELRVRAYRQFLEPYEALQISAMAQAFRVTEEFIENEMRRFIFSRKLNAKIDRVSGTIHTNPPDSRADKMRESLRKGEVLITRLQKLGRLLSA